MRHQRTPPPTPPRKQGGELEPEPEWEPQAPTLLVGFFLIAGNQLDLR
ncbi:MAG: hypothetical protein AB1861_20545 [Cyanobacteriota bacterium]